MYSEQSSKDKTRKEISVLKFPQWIGVFLAIAVPTSLVPFFLGFLLGLSVAHDSVFGSYALISGAFADFIIRSKFRRVLVVFRKPKIPFIALWFLLCVYVIFFRPFE